MYCAGSVCCALCRHRHACRAQLHTPALPFATSQNMSRLCTCLCVCVCVRVCVRYLAGLDVRHSCVRGFETDACHGGTQVHLCGECTHLVSSLYIHTYIYTHTARRILRGIRRNMSRLGEHTRPTKRLHVAHLHRLALAPVPCSVPVPVPVPVPVQLWRASVREAVPCWLQM